MSKKKFSVPVLLLVLLIMAQCAASLNGPVHIISFGTIGTILGKSTPGSNDLYCETGISGKKVGTKYTSLSASSFNTIFACFSNWPNVWTSTPRIKAGIIDAAGNLLGVSINEILLHPIVQSEYRWHVFRLSRTLALPRGDYYLCLWIGGHGAIAYRCSQSQTPASFVIEENYDNATGTIGNLTLKANFDIFALYTEGNVPPAAIIRILPEITVEVNSPVTFDGTASLPGFHDINETQIVNYEWNFGDGTTSESATVQKAYSNVGDYTVTLRVTDSLGLQDTDNVVVWVKPFGGYTSFSIDFEDYGDFSVGLEHSGNYKYWDRERYFMDIYPTAYKFWPETTIVHSGTQSARLELVNPTSDGTRRIQILHDWDPLRTEHIWQEECFYFPSDMPWTDPNTGEYLWRTIHSIVTERMWTTDPNIRTKYQEFSWRIAVVQTKYTNGPIFEVAGLTGVDNNDDGVDDFGPTVQYLELPGGQGVPIGRWFKIKTHIYRNVRNWETNPAGGFVEIWISDELGHEVYRKIENIHSIGINPQRIAAHTPWKTNGTMAYVASGVCHYCGGLAASYGVPSTIYVDDFQVQTTQV